MADKKLNTLSGWGRLGVPGRELLGEDLERLTCDVPLTRGLGRSYGDSSLPPPGRHEVAGSRLADRILGFDPETRLLRAEAGLSLGEVNRLFWPRHWSSPVLPGTQYVTLGGMVAADVHGKNHHIDGCFGAHVTRLLLRVATGEVVECSREVEADLFFATLGGMGLTGHILEVEVRLKSIPSPWVWSETERFSDLESLLEGARRAAEEWPYTVAWVDCLKGGRGMGRGILHRGRWAEPDEAPAEPPQPRRRLAVPVDFPSWALNALSVRAFNFAVYHKHWRRRTRGIVHPEPFFHPLDAILHWNRIYGRRGFSQYQCVIPGEAGLEGVAEFLRCFRQEGGISFLSVIKDCGGEGEGFLSFPRPGISVALDVPVRRGTQDLVNRLNDHVRAVGGRIYLAKDAFTRAEHFEAMEPRLERWREVRRRWDPEGSLASAQSVRVLGDRPPAGSNRKSEDGDE